MYYMLILNVILNFKFICAVFKVWIFCFVFLDVTFCLKAHTFLILSIFIEIFSLREDLWVVPNLEKPRALVVIMMERNSRRKLVAKECM